MVRYTGTVAEVHRDRVLHQNAICWVKMPGLTIKILDSHHGVTLVTYYRGDMNFLAVELDCEVTQVPDEGVVSHSHSAANFIVVDFCAYGAFLFVVTGDNT